MNADGCVLGATKCYAGSHQLFENVFDNELYFGPATTQLFAILKSATFLSFLEQLTTINDLIPDPNYNGAGVYQTMTGGKVDVHADVNRYERYGLHRRVSFFLYLNQNWLDEYGGHLEFWSRDLKSCGQRISPTFGRLVVFSSSDFSYYGHPKPLSSPPHRSRRLLVMHYYTKIRPHTECFNDNCNAMRTTTYQQPACFHCDGESSCTANTKHYRETFSDLDKF